MEVLLRESFPLLFPKNNSLSEFDGFINIFGEAVRVQISVVDKSLHVKGRWNSSTQNVTLKSELHSPTDLIQTLLGVKSKLELMVQNDNVALLYCSPISFTNVLESLDKLGWEKVDSIDHSLQNIVLKAVDGSERIHLLRVSVSSVGSDLALECSTDLPQPFHSTARASKDLQLLYSEFMEQIVLFQGFWNVLDEIDCNVWVLEPEKPLRNHTKRRLAISKKVSVVINVDAGRPNAIPDCEFLGPDNELSTLQQKFVSGIESWDENTSVLSNLQCILGVEFLSRFTTSMEEIQGNCVICYTFHLNDSLPDKTCDNPECGQIFHMECLYEWLRKLTTTRHSFNFLFGECPYCNKSITCKML